jgi:hypothetical protein
MRQKEPKVGVIGGKVIKRNQRIYKGNEEVAWSDSLEIFVDLLH